MSDEKKLIKVKIITPERVLFEGEVEKFIVKSRGEVGDFEILPDHLPMTASIGLGRVILFEPGKEEKQATLFGGFALVEKNAATILTEVAEWPEEIDVERAAKAKERAEENMKNEKMDYTRAHAALIRAIERLDLAKAGYID